VTDTSVVGTQRTLVCIVCGEILAAGTAVDPQYDVQLTDGNAPKLPHEAVAAIRTHAEETGHRRVRLQEGQAPATPPRAQQRTPSQPAGGRLRSTPIRQKLSMARTLPWVEAGMGLITGVLFILTVIDAEWLEHVGINPDGGNGMAERLIVLGLALATMALCALAAYHWGKAATVTAA